MHLPDALNRSLQRCAFWQSLLNWDGEEIARASERYHIAREERAVPAEQSEELGSTKHVLISVPLHFARPVQRQAHRPSPHRFWLEMNDSTERTLEWNG
jgi:hypothetical protein